MAVGGFWAAGVLWVGVFLVTVVFLAMGVFLRGVTLVFLAGVAYMIACHYGEVGSNLPIPSGTFLPEGFFLFCRFCGVWVSRTACSSASPVGVGAELSSIEADFRAFQKCQ